MRKFKILLFLCFLISSSSAFAYSYDVPDDVKERSEQITLIRYEEQTLGDLTLKYELVEAVYVQFWVKKGDSEWIAFNSDSGGIANQFVPDWANEIVIHIEKIGPEGTEDLNYVTDNSEITIWVEDNSNILYACGSYIDDPKNIGLHTGNFYESDLENGLRHWFLYDYTRPSDETFYYVFEVNPNMDTYNLHSFDRDNLNNVVMTIPFEHCGDTTFSFMEREFLIQPLYYMENGNWHVSLREVTRVCPSEELNENMTVIRVGLYDDVRELVTGLELKDAERLGDSSAKIDFREVGGPWRTFVFSDCEWRNLEGNFNVKLAGMYGREAEFYVRGTNLENLQEARRYRFWDRILEVLGFY